MWFIWWRSKRRQGMPFGVDRRTLAEDARNLRLDELSWVGGETARKQTGLILDRPWWKLLERRLSYTKYAGAVVRSVTSVVAETSKRTRSPPLSLATLPLPFGNEPDAVQSAFSDDLATGRCPPSFAPLAPRARSYSIVAFGNVDDTRSSPPLSGASGATALERHGVPSEKVDSEDAYPFLSGTHPGPIPPRATFRAVGAFCCGSVRWVGCSSANDFFCTGPNRGAGGQADGFTLSSSGAEGGVSEAVAPPPLSSGAASAGRGRPLFGWRSLLFLRDRSCCRATAVCAPGRCSPPAFVRLARGGVPGGTPCFGGRS